MKKIAYFVKYNVAIYQRCSGTCLHSLFPGDILSVGHMVVFVWLLLNTAHLRTGRTPPHGESAPENEAIINMTLIKEVNKWNDYQSLNSITVFLYSGISPEPQWRDTRRQTRISVLFLHFRLESLHSNFVFYFQHGRSPYWIINS